MFMSVFFGILLFGFVGYFAVAILSIARDLISGEARRLGMRLEGIGLLFLLIIVTAFLAFIGYYAAIGQITVDFLKDKI